MRKQKRDDIVARADDKFGSSNYAEFTVERKPEGKYALHRFLMICAYVIVFGGLAVLLAFKFTPMVAIVPILLWIGIFFTWRYVSQEYKYVVDMGDFTASVIYGGKQEKVLFRGKIRDFALIAPDGAEYAEKVSGFTGAQTLDITSTVSEPDRYVGLYAGEDGTRKIIYFRATTQSLKALKYYNSSVTVVTDVSR